MRKVDVIMTRITLHAAVLGAALCAVSAVGAQNPPSPAAPSDSGAMPMEGAGPRQGMQGGRREQLRAQIEQRWDQRVKNELGLTDQQMDRLRATVRADRDRRLHVQDREMDLRRAMADQMRPGVAANQDSLSRLQDALVQNHVARAQLEQQEQRELSQFLTPVQRTRLLYMRQMLMQRIQTIREGRWRPQAGRPGIQGPPPADRPGPGSR
jgi:Spy/CpxP family protein refolding chaperone